MADEKFEISMADLQTLVRTTRQGDNQTATVTATVGTAIAERLEAIERQLMHLRKEHRPRKAPEETR